MRGRGFGYTVRRTLLTGAAVAGLISAVAATSAALQGEVDPGVVPDLQLAAVAWVSPNGFAWRDGIRPGQAIVALSTADSPGGWRIETTAAGEQFTSTAAPIETALRESLPFALGALACAVLGLVFLRTRREWVLPAASAAVLGSTVSLGLAVNYDLTTLALAGAVALPASGLAGQLRLPRFLRFVPVAVLVGFIGLWIAARIAGWDTYQSIDGVRGLVAIVAVGVLFGVRVVQPAVSGSPMSLTRPRLLDAVLISGLTCAALAAVYVFHVAPALIGAVALVAVFALAPLRRLTGPFRSAMLADMRAEAAAEGAELERARLARELHDVPLQELVGVIRRLEILPGAESESDDLRALAGHLREVAAELRPPVLDDFGLPAALEQVAEETTTEKVPVTTDIEDETGLVPGERPPPEVELAMYRIAHEAVSNALAHAGASSIQVVARVTRDAIDLEIRDDGSGIEPSRPRRAGREKHLGLASMRRRAQAIDAEFSIDADRRHGTTVRTTWRR